MKTVLDDFSRRMCLLGLCMALGCSGDNAEKTADAAVTTTSKHPALDARPLRALTPIAAPVADDCITDVAAGDHTFTCGAVTFLVMVDERCTKGACGLIFDVHGGTMAGAQMRDNTQLHELAPPHGYLVVHPSATAANTGGVWTADLYPDVHDFMERMIRAFHVDNTRVHITGFSQGAALTKWFLCNHGDLLASTAPVAGALGDIGGASCVGTETQPALPMLYMNGISDRASTIDTSRAMVDAIGTALKLAPSKELQNDGHLKRVSYQGTGGMVLDYIEHDYGGQAVLGGHCIPGGIDITGAPNNFGVNATTCTTGEITIHWGELALLWFLDHPRSP